MYACINVWHMHMYRHLYVYTQPFWNYNKNGKLKKVWHWKRRSNTHKIQFLVEPLLRDNNSYKNSYKKVRFRKIYIEIEGDLVSRSSHLYPLQTVGSHGRTDANVIWQNDLKSDTQIIDLIIFETELLHGNHYRFDEDLFKNGNASRPTKSSSDRDPIMVSTTSQGLHRLQ